MAITISSFKISTDPLAIKYKAVSTSPLCTNVSPGGACVVRNLIEKIVEIFKISKQIFVVLIYLVLKALRQPGLAP